MSSLLWLRRDLRRGDLPALGAAHEAADGGDVHAVFVVDPAIWGRAGAVRTAWLAATLRATVEAYDGRLSIRHGDPRTAVPRLAGELGATSVHVSAEPFPYGRCRDAAVAEALARDDVAWVETGSPYAVTPGRVRKGDGSPYQVFTPFSRAWREHGWPAPAVEPAGLSLAAADDDKRVPAMLDKALRDGPDHLPEAGERAALRRWEAFRDKALDDYATTRDLPARAGTSGLSPYLKVGAVHPRTLLADLAGRRGTRRHDVHRRARLARVLRRRALAPSRVRVARPAGGARGDGVRRPRRRVRRVARGPHRLPDRGRRDAPAARHRLDAQPGAHGHCQLPREGPARLVAARRPALPGPPARRRRRVEQPRLAVGGRHRYRRGAVLPRLQPGHARARSSTRPATTCAAGCRSWLTSRARRHTSRGSTTPATTTTTRGGSWTTPRSGGWRWTGTGRPGGEGARGG